LTPLVSIIIVNWNGIVHLPDCLDSLAAQTFRDFEVVLVDNGSRDDSVSFVRAHYSWVSVVPLPENVGFASGNNRGLEHASGKYIVTLNNDTRAEIDWLDNLVKAADADPTAGMIGCRICSFSNPDTIDSIGMGICPDGMSRGMFRNKHWSTVSLPEVMEVLFPSACAALYKREMIEEIGFFDDDFFAYAEDSDLGLRGRVSGWGAILATQAVVYHKYSQTSGILSPFKVYLVERNHYWVVCKNFPLSQCLSLPFYSFWRYCEQVRAVLAGSGTGIEFSTSCSRTELIKALIKGIFDSVRKLPKMLRKRRQLMKKRRLSPGDFAKLLNRYHITFRQLLDRE